MFHTVVIVSMNVKAKEGKAACPFILEGRHWCCLALNLVSIENLSQFRNEKVSSQPAGNTLTLSVLERIFIMCLGYDIIDIRRGLWRLEDEWAVFITLIPT